MNTTEINPTWIVTTGRTGSSYLVSCLNNALDRIQYQGQKFGEWFSRQKPSPLPHFAKVHRIQFLQFFDDSIKETILNLYPKIKFIHLRRRDIFATTISLYFAEKTNLWNTTNAQLTRNKSISFDEQHILRLYCRVRNRYHCWDHFLVNTDHFALDYEELFQSFDKISNYLNFEVKPDSKFIQLQRPETKDFIDRLKVLVTDCNLDEYIDPKLPV